MSVHSRIATLGEVGEHALLDYLKRRLGAASDGVRVSVGDDAAVLDDLGPAARSDKLAAAALCPTSDQLMYCRSK
ncbi:MAG: hypothetical protein AAFP04_14910, partial [Myxococcota bacterium]